MVSLITTSATVKSSGVLTEEMFLKAVALLSKVPPIDPTPRYGRFVLFPVHLRVYAKRYNARHPGRRIAWRKLNRHQLDAAYKWWARCFVQGFTA